MSFFALFLACAPPIVLVLLLYYLDYHERERPIHVFWAFLVGIISLIPIVVLELLIDPSSTDHPSSTDPASDDSFFSVFFSILFGVALVEEGVKFIGTRILFYPRFYFNEPFDGIIYTGAMGLGFAMLENIFYVWEEGIEIAFLRMFLAVPGHATWSIIMGYYLGLAKFKIAGKWKYHLLALVVPTFLHALYDAPLFQKNSTLLYLIAPLVVLIGIYYAIRAIRFHQQISPFAPENQEN